MAEKWGVAPLNIQEGGSLPPNFVTITMATSCGLACSRFGIVSCIIIMLYSQSYSVAGDHCEVLQTLSYIARIASYKVHLHECGIVATCK